MSLLRLAALLILALWIGGLAALGAIAAPEIFSVLQIHDPVGGTSLAGLVFGAIFRRFQYVGWACAGLLITVLALRAVLGPRPRRFGVRMWTVIGMLAASLATSFILAPRIDAIRKTTPGSVSALPDGDARKTSMGRLHAMSSALMLLTIAGGVALIWWELRDA